jgi:hypothetical protein
MGSFSQKEKISKSTKKPHGYAVNNQYGGADGTRTHYLIHAMDALSQVSYNPIRWKNAASY